MKDKIIGFLMIFILVLILIISFMHYQKKALKAEKTALYEDVLRYKQSLIDVFSTRVEYMNSAINAMKEHYGGTLNYIKEALGVDIDKLKSLYLE